MQSSNGNYILSSLLNRLFGHIVCSIGPDSEAMYVIHNQSKPLKKLILVIHIRIV